MYLWDTPPGSLRVKDPSFLNELIEVDEYISLASAAENLGRCPLVGQLLAHSDFFLHIYGGHPMISHI
eukprot:2589201-Pleurochrysis_carterae.AAC.2